MLEYWNIGVMNEIIERHHSIAPPLRYSITPFFSKTSRFFVSLAANLFSQSSVHDVASAAAFGNVVVVQAGFPVNDLHHSE